jgi:hypothetical protein
MDGCGVSMIESARCDAGKRQVHGTLPGDAHGDAVVADRLNDAPRAVDDLAVLVGDGEADPLASGKTALLRNVEA